jgi:hypothetical protein
MLSLLQLMDRDPQMAQLLNNPELLRDSMNLISNPVSDPAAVHQNSPQLAATPCLRARVRTSSVGFLAEFVVYGCRCCCVRVGPVWGAACR